MDDSQPTARSEPTIRDLYPSLNDEQLREAEQNLERYLALALRVYERVRHDSLAYSQLKALTAATGDSTIEAERSNPTR